MPSYYYVIFVILLLFISTSDARCSIDYPARVYNSSSTKPHVFKFGFAAVFLNYIDISYQLVSAFVDMINNSSDILPDVKLEFALADTQSVDALALAATNTLLYSYDVKALVGGSFDADTKIMSLLARLEEVPMIATSAYSVQFANKIEYPYLVRVIPSDILQMEAILQMINSQGWKQFMVLYSSQAGGAEGIELLSLLSAKANISMSSMKYETSAGFVDNLKSVMLQNRLRILVHVLWVNDAVVLFPKLVAVGLMHNPTYVNILSNSIASFYLFEPALAPFLNGTLGVVAAGGKGAWWEKFDTIWNSKAATVPNWLPIGYLGLAAYTGDALLVIAAALDKLMKTGLTLNEINGTTLLNSMRNIEYLGTTGNVTLSSDLERKGEYTWLNFAYDGVSPTKKEVAVYSAVTENTTIFTAISFYGGASIVSDGRCLCKFGTCNSGTDVCSCYEGFSGILCETKDPEKSGASSIVIALAISIPIVVIIVGALFAYRYVKVKRASAIKDVSMRQRSVIGRKDIELNQIIGRGASGIVFRAMFRGTEVAVKRILTENVTKEVIEEFELESAIMAGLRHPNIVLFMGSCIVPAEKEMLLVMEFMAKGSLHDIIHNTHMSFPFELGLHIAGQAAKGMNFLHQSNPPILHRDLKSHNILLDDKWNARIADFGISKIKDISGGKKNKEESTGSLGTVYWTAPEVFNGHPNTEKSDVYSFGIVLWELAHRDTPHGNKDPMAVAMDVATNGLRPAITAVIPDAFKVLMGQCWAQNPAERPDFTQISQQLRHLSIKYPLVSFHSENSQQEAPSGFAYFVQTEIAGANQIWSEYPEDMLKAITMHNQMIRASLSEYEGYEAEFMGNGFLLAFEDITNAIDFCTAIQTSLLNIAWPDAICDLPMCSKVHDREGRLIYSRLRVRMAINGGTPNSSFDISNGKTSFAGPVIDRVRKLLLSARDASIITTSLVVKKINKSKDIKFMEEIKFEACGRMQDTSKTKHESIYSILPASLSGRANNQSELSLHTTVDVDESSFNYTPSDSYVTKWLVPHEQITIHESLGKGSVGDFYRASWHGQEVALKVVINQKFPENDLLKLKAKAVALSKLSHPNLVTNYAMCLDPGKISILQEYIPSGNLRQILSNENLSLSWPQKIKIVQQIAEGMRFLSSHPDPYIHTHTNFKSSNILVKIEKGEVKTVKVTDFGQASLKDLARTMTSIGTVAWTAPEILSGEPITPAISVYAFGIVLYEIASRKLPYVNEHPVKLVSKVLSGYRPSCSGLDIPSEYKHLMEQCWHPDPVQRPTWPSIFASVSSFFAQ